MLIGSIAALPCVAHGYPEPTLSWSQRIKGSEEDEPIPTDNRVRISSSNDQLSISQITLDDEGIYSCTATNEFGTVTASGQLTVTGTGMLHNITEM